jgi:hypothetical protein
VSKSKTSSNGTQRKAKPAPPPERYVTQGAHRIEPVAGDGSTTPDDVFIDATLAAHRGKGDAAVWEGSKLVAVVPWDEANNKVGARAERDRILREPPPRRYSNQIPMLRQSTTFSPPWCPSPITLEIIMLPEGTGEGYDGENVDRDGIPLNEPDLRVLEEAGWTENAETAVRIFTRIVRDW